MGLGSPFAISAKNWFVQGGADGDPFATDRGTKKNPFATLEEVELNTLVNDKINVLASSIALDAGLAGDDNLFTLKDKQKLIGPGKINCNKAYNLICTENNFGAVITNSNGGDGFTQGAGVVLSNKNRISGIHFDNTQGAAIYGLNADRVQIRNVLMTATNQMGASNSNFDGFSGSAQREGYPAVSGILLNYTEPSSKHEYSVTINDVVARQGETLPSLGGILNIHAKAQDIMQPISVDAFVERVMASGQIDTEEIDGEVQTLIRQNPLGFAQQAPSYMFMAEGGAQMNVSLINAATFDTNNNDGMGVHSIGSGKININISKYHFVGSSKNNPTPGIVETGVEVIDELGLFAENFLKLSFPPFFGDPIPLTSYPIDPPVELSMENSTLEKGEIGVILLVHDSVVIDLGGGPLNSSGNNRIFDNNEAQFPGFNLGVGASAYLRPIAPKTLTVHASNNYWGVPIENGGVVLYNNENGVKSLASFNNFGNKQQEECVLVDVEPQVPDFATFECLEDSATVIITAPALTVDPGL